MIIFLLGIFAGIIANINQYLINKAGEGAPDFSNGIFLTAANLGTTLGTSICGIFISSLGSNYSILGSVFLMIAGLVMIALTYTYRSRKRVY